MKIVIGAIYEHFKGGKYKVLDVARHSETLEEMVYYINLDDGSSWVRPSFMFLEKIKRNEKTIERFKLIKD